MPVQNVIHHECDCGFKGLVNGTLIDVEIQIFLFKLKPQTLKFFCPKCGKELERKKDTGILDKLVCY